MRELTLIVCSMWHNVKVGGTNSVTKHQKIYFYCAPPPHFCSAFQLTCTAHIWGGTQINPLSPLYTLNTPAVDICKQRLVGRVYSETAILFWNSYVIVSI